MSNNKDLPDGFVPDGVVADESYDEMPEGFVPEGFTPDEPVALKPDFPLSDYLPPAPNGSFTPDMTERGTPVPPKIVPPDQPSIQSELISDGVFNQRADNFWKKITDVGGKMYDANEKARAESNFFAAPYVGGMAQAQTFADEVLQPTTAYVQRLLGEPVVEAAVRNLVPRGLGVAPEITTLGPDGYPQVQDPSGNSTIGFRPKTERTEFLTRSLLSVIGGQGALGNMDPKRMNEAITELEMDFGVQGAAYMQALMVTTGATAPMLLVNPGFGAAVGNAAARTVSRSLAITSLKEAPFTARLLVKGSEAVGQAIGNATEGALMGGGQAMFQPGANVREGIKWGAAGGAIMSIGINGVMVGGKYAGKFAGFATRKSMQALADEGERLANWYLTNKLPDGIKVREYQMGEFDPSYAKVVVDQHGDLAMQHSTYMPETGTYAFARAPLKSPKDLTIAMEDAATAGAYTSVSTEALKHPMYMKYGSIGRIRTQDPFAPESESLTADEQGPAVVTKRDDGTYGFIEKIKDRPIEDAPAVGDYVFIPYYAGISAKGKILTFTENGDALVQVIRKNGGNHGKPEVVKLREVTRTKATDEMQFAPEIRKRAAEEYTISELESVTDKLNAKDAEFAPGEKEALLLTQKRLKRQVKRINKHRGNAMGKTVVVSKGKESSTPPRGDGEATASLRMDPNNGKMGVKFVAEDGSAVKNPETIQDRLNATQRDRKVMEHGKSANDDHTVDGQDPESTRTTGKVIELNVLPKDGPLKRESPAEIPVAERTAKLQEELDGLKKENNDLKNKERSEQLEAELAQLREENSRLKDAEYKEHIKSLPVGDEVYVRRDGSTKTRKARYLGVDPKNPNRVIVRLGDGPRARTVSLDAIEVQASSPRGIAAAPLVPPPVPQPTLSQQIIAADNFLAAKTNIFMKMMKQGAFLTKNASGWIARNLGAHHQQVAAELERLVTGLDNVSNIYNTRRTMLRNAELSLQGTDSKLDDFFDQDITKLATGEWNETDIAAKWGNDWNKVKEIYKPMLVELEQNHLAVQAIAAKYGIKLPTRDDTMRYLATIYRAHTMPPGEWRKIAPDVVLEKAVNEILRGKYIHDGPIPLAPKVKGEIYTFGEIHDELMRILNEDDPWDALFKSSKIKADPAWKNLKHKKSLPSWLENVMGKETSGTLRMVQSIAKQRAILQSHSMWAKLSDMAPFVSQGGVNPHFRAGPDAEMGITYQLPDNPLIYDGAAGGYIHKSLEPIAEATKMLEKPFQAWEKIGGLFKGNLVALGGAKTWINATMENLFLNSTLTGGYTVLQPIRMARFMREAIKDFVASGELTMKGMKPVNTSRYNEDGSLNMPVHQLLEAKSRGVDVEGMLGEGLGADHKFLKALQDKLGPNSTNGPKSGLDILKTIRDLAIEYGSKPGRSATYYYDFIDRTFRYSQYLALREQYLARGAGKITLEQAADMAASRVNRYFPNMHKPNMLAQKIRKTPFGFLAPFATIWTEQLRVGGTAIADLMKGDEEARYMLGRILGVYMLWQGAKVAKDMSLQAYYGLTPAEVRATQETRSDRARQNVTAMEEAIGVDDKGNVIMADPGNWMFFNRLAQRDMDENEFVSVGNNLLLGMANGGMSEGGLRNMLVQSGLAEQQVGDKKLIEGQAGISNMLSFMARAGMAPGAGVKLWDAGRKAGAVGTTGRLEEKMSPATAVISQFLSGTKTISEDSFMQAVVQYMGEKKEFQSVINKIWATDFDQDPVKNNAERKRLTDAVVARINREADKLNARNKANKEAGVLKDARMQNTNQK